MISRQHNGKIGESKNAFIDKQMATNNCRTDSSHSSPNSVKSANSEKVIILILFLIETIKRIFMNQSEILN